MAYFSHVLLQFFQVALGEMQPIFPILIIFDSGKTMLHAELKSLNFLKHGYS